MLAVDAFVPPLATGKTPDTWVVKPIFPQLGAVDTPPDISALPVATSASVAVTASFALTTAGGIQGSEIYSYTFLLMGA